MAMGATQRCCLFLPGPHHMVRVCSPVPEEVGLQRGQAETPQELPWLQLGTDVMWNPPDPSLGVPALLSPLATGSAGWPPKQPEGQKPHTKASSRGKKHPKLSPARIWLSMQAIVLAWHVDVPCSLSRTVPRWVSLGRWSHSLTHIQTHRGAPTSSLSKHTQIWGLQPLDTPQEGKTLLVPTASLPLAASRPGGRTAPCHHSSTGGVGGDTSAPRRMGVLPWDGAPPGAPTASAPSPRAASLASPPPWRLLGGLAWERSYPPPQPPAAPSPI